MSPKANFAAVLIFLALLLVVFVLVSLLAGAASLSWQSLWAALGRQDSADTAYQILWYVRLPRTLAALLAGSALAVAGVILQAVLHNALAGPGIIGVNSGAGFMVLLAVVLFPAMPTLTVLAAFFGALLAAGLVYLIARKSGGSRLRIVLTGIAISAMLGALTDSLLTFFPEILASRSNFLIGGFSGANMSILAPSLVIIPFAIAVSIFFARDLNILALGEEVARSLGSPTKRYRLLFFALAALLAGSAVSFAGLIGFVGLIIPHIARLVLGSENRRIIPFAALLGAVFTLACDLVARLLFVPYELPVGIIMSFLGGPFFIYLLLVKRREAAL